MKKFILLNLWWYKLDGILNDWWYNTSFCAWQAKDGFYLSDNPSSEKYKVADTFEELAEYLQELKKAYEEEE